MNSIFNIASSPVAQGIKKPSDWIYLDLGLKRNLRQVIMYYRRNPMAVNSEHFLVRLLQSIAVPQSLNLERYYSNVDAMALNFSMSLGMTSSIYNGKLFNSVFYGNSDEILIANSDSFDINEAQNNWENLEPIKVLRHPVSNLNLNLPDGTINSTESGLAVISINIPMLAIQYRAFRLEEMVETTTDTGIQFESQKSVMQFIHMYVLPNMLYSHLDYVIFNRIYNLEFGIPFGESVKKHPFYITDFTSKLNYFHNTILDQLRKTNKDFSGILQSIPTITKHSLFEVMMLPSIAITRQVSWAIFISRLSELLFLFRLSKESHGNKNQSEIGRVLRQLTMYKSDNLFRSMLPNDKYIEVSEQIKDLIELTKA
jgi:hypothetical protein